MKFPWIVLSALLSACANIPSPTERLALADSLASQQHWHAETLAAGHFDLMVYLPAHLPQADSLNIYIEGDGLAWITGSQASSDPTPRDPLALRLALAQPDGNAVYLARPCQYIDAEASGCSRSYWTSLRFAPEVIASTNRAIDLLKQRTGAVRLTLVGYSGGGTVAALVAAQRHDVERLITIAGNLDHRAWTTYHRIQPLDGSLNPADDIERLQHISQWHLVGGRDEVVPPILSETFAQRFPAGSEPVLKIETEFDHHCCWVAHWPILWREIVRNMPRQRPFLK